LEIYQNEYTYDARTPECQIDVNILSVNLAERQILDPASRAQNPSLLRVSYSCVVVLLSRPHEHVFLSSVAPVRCACALKWSFHIMKTYGGVKLNILPPLGMEVYGWV
jgi:hypothetical protein